MPPPVPCPKCGTPDQYGDNCENCSATYDATDLKKPRSLLSGATPVLKKSQHYFFDLAQFTQMLAGWTRSGTMCLRRCGGFMMLGHSRSDDSKISIRRRSTIRARRCAAGSRARAIVQEAEQKAAETSAAAAQQRSEAEQDLTRERALADSTRRDLATLLRGLLADVRTTCALYRSEHCSLQAAEAEIQIAAR